MLMNIDELLFIAWVWARRQKHQVYPNMRGVYNVVTGVYTTEGEIEVVVLGFFLISQVMDRFYKKAYGYGRKQLFWNL